MPAVEGFAPAGLRVYMNPWKDEPDNPILVGAFRYAEGGKTLKEQLDEAGRIVTHGILFDSGSARIKAETYKIDATRLETKGWGEGKPIDKNDTAEGKANNRRVELVKI